MDEFESTLSSPPPWHSGTTASGRSYNWMPTDTEENYKKMIQDPAHKQHFADLGWDKPDSITYKINRYGFRCNEFKTGVKSIVALGCSYTFGTGLPVETTWSYLVAKSLNLECYNLAWGGTSADTCFMTARYWIPVLRPELVVMAAPPVDRIDIVRGSGTPPVQTIMGNTTEGEFGNDPYLKHWFSNDKNSELNNVKNKLAVQALCQNLGIPCLTYNAHEYFARSREEVGYARDYMHAGPKGHTMFAERIVDDWRKKYT